MAKKYSGASTSLDDFKQLALLGEGAYSAVYKVQRLADGEIYALKKVKLPSLSDKEKQNALNEVRLLASVQDKHIIAYKEAFFDDKTRCLCIVTECADGGDLMHQIVKCQKERSHLKEADVWRYLHGMCQGLKALHDMRILHRDLKCANVFLQHEPEGMIAKLGDFNVSKVAKRGLCMTQTGTPYYASPEVWRDMPYDAKSDMWSLGCVLYEMVALRPPFRAEDMEGLYRKVLRGQYPRIPPHYSHDLSDVIAALLQVNPRHRPSIDQLMQMPVLRRHQLDSPQAPETPSMSDLLNTIKLPKNVIDLSGCLPKPRYDLPKVLSVDPHDAVSEYSSQLATGGRGHDHLGGRGLDQKVREDEDSAQPGYQPDPPPDSLDAYLQSAAGSPSEKAVLNLRKNSAATEAASVKRGSPTEAMLASEKPSYRHQGRRQECATPDHGSVPPGSRSGHPQPCRPQRESRRPMAQYARNQYELSSQAAAAQQQQQQQQQQQPQVAAPKPVASGGLRLPRIFSRG
uniref:non-specific serine/threonine protein kinase n=1 Tax=Alexandrium monilatum TaxID=311494 RepID=A0A7S4QSW5_9DINO|mmetsp:Transcript_73244/g.218541  ORF Transcript_73244/g.218541 Transcript_73244/m.218541 type:complete len:514 (-) Transcript_73244:40-1581(-)